LEDSRKDFARSAKNVEFWEDLPPSVKSQVLDDVSHALKSPVFVLADTANKAVTMAKFLKTCFLKWRKTLRRFENSTAAFQGHDLPDSSESEEHDQDDEDDENSSEDEMSDIDFADKLALDTERADGDGLVKGESSMQLDPQDNHVEERDSLEDFYVDDDVNYWVSIKSTLYLPLSGIIQNSALLTSSGRILRG